MIPFAEVRAIAELLLEAFSLGEPLAPITSRVQGFELDDAYEVLREIASVRAGEGWVPAGRKIGFTNRTIWERYHVEAPMWAHIWDRTVAFAADDTATISLGNMLEPRIEPEVVFKLRGPIPTADDPIEILSSVEWLAPGFEIVQSLYPDWTFTLADATAAFGVHGRLVVGTPVAVTAENRELLAVTLAEFEATLACDGNVVDRGIGSNALDSPALALAYLARVVADQPRQPQLVAGEVITTGTITDAWPVRPGENWTSDYGSLGLNGLTVSFA
jgi:2-oxo-3-hexenedioate decarboxylase